MKLKIQKDKKGAYISIPKKWLEKHGFKEGDTVEISLNVPNKVMFVRKVK